MRCACACHDDQLGVRIDGLDERGEVTEVAM
jgi:hypothetical protein